MFNCFFPGFFGGCGGFGLLPLLFFLDVAGCGPRRRGCRPFRRRRGFFY